MHKDGFSTSIQYTTRVSRQTFNTYTRFQYKHSRHKDGIQYIKTVSVQTFNTWRRFQYKHSIHKDGFNIHIQYTKKVSIHTFNTQRVSIQTFNTQREFQYKHSVHKEGFNTFNTQRGFQYKHSIHKDGFNTFSHSDYQGKYVNVKQAQWRIDSPTITNSELMTFILISGMPQSWLQSLLLDAAALICIDIHVKLRAKYTERQSFGSDCFFK